MISIIVPCSHMASVDGGPGLHIKEDSIITIITIEDAITGIIGYLVLNLLCTLTKCEQKRRTEGGCCVCVCERETEREYNSPAEVVLIPSPH